jgi:hypothetical protein
MWSQFRHDQDLRQRGGVTNISRNGHECVRDDGMFSRQRVKTVTHIVEFLSFTENCIRRHCKPDFRRAKERRTSGGLSWFRKPEREFSGRSSESNFPMNAADTIIRRGHAIVL